MLQSPHGFDLYAGSVCFIRQYQTWIHIQSKVVPQKLGDRCGALIFWPLAPAGFPFCRWIASSSGLKLAVAESERSVFVRGETARPEIAKPTCRRSCHAHMSRLSQRYRLCLARHCCRPSALPCELSKELPTCLGHRPSQGSVC